MSSSADVLKRLLPALKNDLLRHPDAAGSFPSLQSKEVVDRLCRDVLQQCTAAISALKSFHNATHASSKIPPEVWCIVWSFLDEDEVVGVTHVCRTWRAISIEYAPFWTIVRFWTTVHAAGSSCDGTLCHCPDQVPAAHNLDKVATWLARSKSLPISFDMSIYPVFSNHKLTVELANIVRPHGPRITTMVCEFGDFAFFTRFTRLVLRFDSLSFLRMSRGCYLHGEHNFLPISKLGLRDLHVPQLRELRGYGDFLWDIPDSPHGHSFPVLERLRCNFADTQTFYACLRSCPSLTFLNAELNDLRPVIHPLAPTESVSNLAPRLKQLILDRMTAQWEALFSHIVRRPTLRRLTLRYNKYDPETLFLPLTSMSGSVYLRLRVTYDTIILDATDEYNNSRSLEFHEGGVDPNDMPALGRMWGHLRASALRKLRIAWSLRGALLNTMLHAQRLSRITFTVEHPAGKSAGRSVEEVTARNDPTLAGRPNLPSLTELKFVHADYADMRSHTSLSEASVDAFAEALSDSELLIELAGVDLL